MTRLGNFVEGLIGQAKSAKTQLGTRSGIQPVIALESRLSPERMRQLLDFVTDRLVLPTFPALKDKSLLEVGEGPMRYVLAFAERKPRVNTGVVVGSGLMASGPVPSGALLLRGVFKALPFPAEHFDFAAVRLTTPLQGDVVGPVKEVGRVLTPDGTAILVDYHPFGLFAKSGASRMRGVESSIRGLEDYYKMCRLAGLSITDIREAFIDDSLRNFFGTPEEAQIFRDLKGSPLILCLMVTKMRQAA